MEQEERERTIAEEHRLKQALAKEERQRALDEHLLKQALALEKRQRAFDEEYRSKQASAK